MLCSKPLRPSIQDPENKKVTDRSIVKTLCEKKLYAEPCDTHDYISIVFLIRVFMFQLSSVGDWFVIPPPLNNHHDGREI